MGGGGTAESLSYVTSIWGKCCCILRRKSRTVHRDAPGQTCVNRPKLPESHFNRKTSLKHIYRFQRARARGLGRCHIQVSSTWSGVPCCQIWTLEVDQSHGRCSPTNSYQGSPHYHCLQASTHSSSQVFRKYSNALGPDALSLIEHILIEHEITEDDLESSIETLAREYNRQDGRTWLLFMDEKSTV